MIVSTVAHTGFFSLLIIGCCDLSFVIVMTFNLWLYLPIKMVTNFKPIKIKVGITIFYGYVNHEFLVLAMNLW